MKILAVDLSRAWRRRGLLEGKQSDYGILSGNFDNCDISESMIATMVGSLL